jgi:hypothetical protein
MNCVREICHFGGKVPVLRLHQALPDARSRRHDETKRGPEGIIKVVILYELYGGNMSLWWQSTSLTPASNPPRCLSTSLQQNKM